MEHPVYICYIYHTLCYTFQCLGQIKTATNGYWMLHHAVESLMYSNTSANYLLECSNKVNKELILKINKLPLKLQLLNRVMGRIPNRWLVSASLKMACRKCVQMLSVMSHLLQIDEICIRITDTLVYKISCYKFTLSQTVSTTL